MAESLNDIYSYIKDYPFKVIKTEMTVSNSKIPLGFCCSITGFDLRYGGFYIFNQENPSINSVIKLDPFEKNWESLHFSNRDTSAIENLFKNALVHKVPSILNLFS